MKAWIHRLSIYEKEIIFILNILKFIFHIYYNNFYNYSFLYKSRINTIYFKNKNIKRIRDMIQIIMYT